MEASSGKAPGQYCVPAEVFKCGGSQLPDVLHQLLCRCWEEELSKASHGGLIWQGPRTRLRPGWRVQVGWKPAVWYSPPAAMLVLGGGISPTGDEGLYYHNPAQEQEWPQWPKELSCHLTAMNSSKAYSSLPRGYILNLNVVSVPNVRQWIWSSHWANSRRSVESNNSPSSSHLSI